MCDSDRIQSLRIARGWSVEKLASAAGVDRKTIDRVLKGRPAYLDTIATLARALDVQPETIAPQLRDTEMDKRPSGSAFRLEMTVEGSLASPEQAPLLARITPDVVARLEGIGVRVTAADATLSVQTSDTETLRIIVLIHGSFGDGKKFWVYAAVRPSKFNEFQMAQGEGRVNLYKFEPFGEIVVSGTGDPGDGETPYRGPEPYPPYAVTDRVAEIYGVDPASIRRTIYEVNGVALPPKKV